ncbi:hypothetical protein C0993_001199 [Termitomyces sp. T159_Od127]|nr:hypothetical protein C0993_001199 [Termitomyces sp. T159_Od127]
MQEALDSNQADPNLPTDPHNTPDYTNDKEALLDFNVFSALATHSHATALSPDTPSAHLPSQSSQTLFLCTTLPHSSTPVNTLVDSSATNNFVDKSLATLAATSQKLLLSIHLTLFDGSSTSTSNITHYVQTTLTFLNSQRQDLQLLVTHLHASTLLILGLPWLHSINLCIDWWNVTLNFDCQAMEHSELISFDVTALFSTADHPHTLWQLHSNSLALEPVSLLSASASNPLATPVRLELPAPQQHSWTTLANPLPLGAPLAFPPNIPCNKYKGPNYPTHCLWMTLDPDDVDQPPKPLNLDALDIKIIGLAPFARIIQDGTPAFQLHISPALLEEHLGADTTAPEPKTEEQILHKVVSLEYHKFADV